MADPTTQPEPCTVDGQTLTFGVSGKLADNDLVLYDRETESALVPCWRSFCRSLVSVTLPS